MFLFVTITLGFQPADWVEFSPYEIGMAKYGTFMTPDLFGSKFFMGTVVKKYEENPLHFLMGEKHVFICSHTKKVFHRTYKLPLLLPEEIKGSTNVSTSIKADISEVF